MEYFKGGDLSKYLLNVKNNDNNEKNLKVRRDYDKEISCVILSRMPFLI